MPEYKKHIRTWIQAQPNRQAWGFCSRTCSSQAMDDILPALDHAAARVDILHPTDCLKLSESYVQIVIAQPSRLFGKKMNFKAKYELCAGRRKLDLFAKRKMPTYLAKMGFQLLPNNTFVQKLKLHGKTVYVMRPPVEILVGEKEPDFNITISYTYGGNAKYLRIAICHLYKLHSCLIERKNLSNYVFL